MNIDPHALKAAIAHNFSGQIDWLSRLVAFRSTRGNEAACQDWLADELGKRGYVVDKYALADVAIAGVPGYSPAVDVDYSKAIQVVATHDVAEPKGRSLILQSHIDVVPAGAPELWEVPPFEPRLLDGWLHGRGAADMKAGASAIVFALDALRSLGAKPASRVHVEMVSEEECTGNGALSTLVRGYRADAAFIPESTNHKVIRAELGSVWFRLRILGRPGHVAFAAGPGAHAIFAAQAYITALAELTRQINIEAESHEWYGSIASPVKFNPGKIRGGDWLGSVPSWCELECRISVLPGTELADMRARVEAAVQTCAAGLDGPVPALTWIGFQAYGHVVAPGSDAEKLLAVQHEAVVGTPLEPLIMTATSDTRYFSHHYGMQAICYGGIGRGMHAPDEAVDLESLKATTEIIARFIAGWCQLQPASA